MTEESYIKIISEKRNLQLLPRLLSDITSRTIQVDVCTTCSAIIFDPVEHDLWHSSLKG